MRRSWRTGTRDEIRGLAMRFWDSSGLIPLIAAEKGSPQVQKFYKDDPEVLVWSLTDLEILSSLCQRLREGKLSARDFDRADSRLGELRDRWHEVKNLRTVRVRARRLLRSHPLRAGDALQLAAALVALREEADGFEFLTYDAQLRRAAHSEGFAVPI